MKSNVLKRMRIQELETVRNGDLSLCKKLRFFMQYPDSVASKLLSISRYIRIDSVGEKIFE